MANKLEVYNVQDSVTGQTFKIEGPAGATDEELYEFLSTQDLGDVPQANPVAPSTPAPTPQQEVVTVAEMGADSFARASDPSPLSDSDAAEYVRLTKDLNVAPAEISKFLADRGKVFTPQAQQELTEFRKAVAAGEETSDVVSYTNAATDILGEFTPAEDPDIGEWGAALESGMAYNPMGIVQRLGEDWFDAEQGGVTKDQLRTLYPDLDDEGIEGLHDGLIGELRRRELINADNQIKEKDVGLIKQFIGDMIGGASPVDLVPLGRGSKVISQVAEGAAVNAAIDSALQVHDTAYGAQSEYNFGQTAIAAAAGGALQGGVAGVAKGAQALSNRKGGAGGAPKASPSGEATVRVPRNRKGSKQYKEQLTESSSDIAEVINTTTKNWQNAPEITVHDRFTDLKGVDNNAIGVYLGDGKVAINSEAVIKEAAKLRVKPEDVVRAVTFHEGLGHFGLAARYGDELDATITQFYDNNVGKFQSKVDEWLEANPDAYANDPNRLARAGEEVLAEMSEKGQIDVTLFDTVANLIKKFARDMGIDLKFSDREIRSMLALSHATVGNKQKLARGAGLRSDEASFGPRYMYLGRKSRTADLLSLAEREDDHAFDSLSGLSKQELEDEYGPNSPGSTDEWFLGPDGKWRYEIDDKNTKFTTLGYAETMDDDMRGFVESIAEATDTPLWEAMQDLEGKSLFEMMADFTIREKYGIKAVGLGDLIDHPTLFEAYPELRNVVVTRDSTRYEGAFYPGQDKIDISPRAKNPESVLLHEIQHWVQEKEDFARGGNDASALKNTPDNLILKGSRNLVQHKAQDVKKTERFNEVVLEVSKDPLSVELYELRSEMEATAEKQRKAEKAGKEDLAKTLREQVLKMHKESNELRNEIVEKHFGLTYRDMVLNEENKPLQTEWTRLDGILHAPAKLSGFSRDIRIKRQLKTAKKEQEALETFQKLLEAEDVRSLRLLLNYDHDAKHSMYMHLFGEVEARDTQNRYELFKDGGIQQGLDRRFYDPYSSERSSIEPEDYIFAFDDSEAASKERYMRPSRLEDIEADPEGVTQNDLFEMGTARGILEGALESYEPRYRSWAEAKADARARGLNSGHIRKSKGIGELDRKMFQYDQVAQAMSERLAVLGAEIQRGNFAKKGEYLETLYKFNEVVGTIFEDQAQIGRALNALKAIETTKRRYGELNRILEDYEADNSLVAFADDQVFARFATQMQEMLENGNSTGAATMARQVVKPYWWQYILSFRHAMMLSGLATHAKNAMDNSMMIARELEETLLAAPLDWAREGLRASGKDVDYGVSGQEVAARTYGLIRAALDSGTYINAAKAFKEGHGSTPYSAKIEMQDAYVPGVGKVNNALFAADMFFRAFHKNANLYALGVRQARAEGFKGRALFEEGSVRANDPNEQMIAMADKKTDEALLVDTPSGWVAKAEAFKAIRPNMKGSEQAMAFAANTLMPFFRVTDRLLFQAIRRSPLSFLDKNTREAFAAGGAERDIAIARTAYGTALMAYYWNAAGDEEGGVVGETTKDYNKLKALQAGGFRPNSVVEDGRYVDATALNLSFNPLDLQNNVAVNVASIREAWEKGANEGDTLEALGAASKAFLTFLASQSYAENLSMYLEPAMARSDQEQDVAAANFVGSLGSQFVPAIARQFNQQSYDPVKRDTRGDKSFGDRVYGRIASGVPGLSETLPTKYDSYGDVIPHGRTLLGMNNYTEVKDDPVSQELTKLEKSTDKVVVSDFRGSFTHNGENIKLPAEAIQEWNRVQGYYLRTWMSEEIQSPEWSNMSNEDRIAIVKDVKKEAHEATKEYMLPLLGLEGEE